MLPEIVKYQDIAVPIVTFIMGFFASRFTLSKADRLTHDAAKFALSKQMAETQNQAYISLMQALTKFVSDMPLSPTIDDFFAVSGPAQNYLFQQKMVADAILANQIDAQSRDATFIPKLTETAHKIIPAAYGALKKIADKHGLPYPEEFERANYQSIFDAVEKYGKLGPYAPQAFDSPTPGSPGAT